VKRIQRKRLLIFNSHEAWIYQLSALDYALDIIVGLNGRYTQDWDTRIRPIPVNARIIDLHEAQNSSTQYDCIIAHNTTDLLDVRHRLDPRILVLHLPIEARRAEEGSIVPAAQMRKLLYRYVGLVGAHVVAVSSFKGKSWGFTEDVVPFGFETEDYLPCSGENACALRVCNFVQRRKKFLLWDFHQAAFHGLPVRIVGHNPEMPSVEPSQNWNHLKGIFQSHRFFIHTADPELEDGYNMATIEAMAAGLPVLGNRHPGSPVIHGASGFLSDDPLKLRDYAKVLLGNRELAMKMGAQARKTVKEKFSLGVFKTSFEKSIKMAQQKSQAAFPSLLAARLSETPVRIRARKNKQPSIMELAAKARNTINKARKVVVQ
jgi:hypothetical protein